jgi:putative two-component system response regulator
VITNANVKIYAAIREPEDRSKIENLLVMDGYRVSVFASASDLWDIFRIRPARIIISDRRFPDMMSGVQLTQRIREHQTLPYTYIILQSVMNQLHDIQEGIEAGADDYLIKPHHPFELRARLLVALRWVDYIDSLFAEQNNKP